MLTMVVAITALVFILEEVFIFRIIALQSSGHR